MIRQRGAILAEFSLVLPVCIILVIVTYAVGKFLAQAIWNIQTAYHTALEGAVTPQLERDGAMRNMYGPLAEAHFLEQSNGLQYVARADDPVTQKLATVDILPMDADDTVTAAARGNTRGGGFSMAAWLLPLRVQLTAPAVIGPPTGTVIQLNVFENPADEYSCCGERGGTAGGPCATCTDETHCAAPACGLPVPD